MQICAICGKQKEEKMNVIPIFKTVNVGNSEVHIDGQMFICSDCWHKCPKCNKPIKTDEIQKVFETEHCESILWCDCHNKKSAKFNFSNSSIAKFREFVKKEWFKIVLIIIFIAFLQQINTINTTLKKINSNLNSIDTIGIRNELQDISLRLIR